MPVSADRDLAHTRDALEEWLAARMPEADGVTVADLRVPGGTGFSNETLVLDLSFREDGDDHERSLVVRLQAPEATIFPDLDVGRQATVMSALARHSDVPVPEVLWTEPDGTLLGTPFFVMEKVEGEVPTDIPSYNAEGFIAAMAPAERRKLWESAIEKMARVHRVDWRAAGLDLLDRPADGPTGLPQLLTYLERYTEWAVRRRPYPTAERAWEWLRSHRPSDPGPVTLCWGDARVSNMMFSGTECVAVLDWEMAFLGPAEQDLGWWLYFDRFSAEGYGVERLDGLPGREESIAHYEALAGRKVRDVEFYEVLAGYYFAVIMVHVAETLKGMDLLPDDSDFAFDNTATELLGKVLAEYGA